MNSKLILIMICLIGVSFLACGESSKSGDDASKQEVIDPMKDKGVGPIKSLELTDIDAALATKGEKVFAAKCASCHKMEKRYIGPAMKDVTKRRTPEWIMNMILDPETMVKENATAKQLLMEYSAPMANQNLTEDEARSILEYFRNNDSK